MANEENLRIPTSEEAREIGRKGGIASGKARREKATMLATLEKLLNEKPKDSELTYKELATEGLICGAIKGNPKNYEIIQQAMERKEKKDEELNIVIMIPAYDISKSFVDVNRNIDNRDYREYYF